MAYIAMAYIAMTYVVMAYIVMACTDIACTGMACIVMAHIVMAHIIMAHIVMAAGGSETKIANMLPELAVTDCADVPLYAARLGAAADVPSYMRTCDIVMTVDSYGLCTYGRRICGTQS